MHCVTSILFDYAGLSIAISKLPRQAGNEAVYIYTRTQYVDKSVVSILFFFAFAYTQSVRLLNIIEEK